MLFEIALKVLKPKRFFDAGQVLEQLPFVGQLLELAGLLGCHPGKKKLRGPVLAGNQHNHAILGAGQ